MSNTERPAKKVLVVDDELGLQRMVGLILRSGGYAAEFANNGREGLKMFQESTWDIILVDRAMPEMGGEEMAMAVKSTHPAMPVILVTGVTQQLAHPELFEAILTKPFTPGDLLNQISQAIARAAG